jgi:hypothetical protein
MLDRCSREQLAKPTQFGHALPVRNPPAALEPHRMIRMHRTGWPRGVDKAIVHVLLEILDDPLEVPVSIVGELPMVPSCRANDI